MKPAVLNEGHAAFLLDLKNAEFDSLFYSRVRSAGSVRCVGWVCFHSVCASRRSLRLVTQAVVVLRK